MTMGAPQPKTIFCRGGIDENVELGGRRYIATFEQAATHQHDLLDAFCQLGLPRQSVPRLVTAPECRG